MTELQRELCAQLEKFRKDKIEPTLEQDERDQVFRVDLFQELGKLGYCSMPLPEEYGGADLSYLDFCEVLSELAKSSVSYAVTLSVSTMVQAIIKEFGNENQKKLFLPELTSGQGIGAFCLSESSSGSDAASLKTTAKKVEGGYILNGTKMWITSGGIAKTYIVMARTGAEGSKGISAFIVPSTSEGLSFGKAESKMGWKVSPTKEVIFNKCFVPDENLLSEEGNGFKIAMSALDKGRFTIGAIAVGLAQRALDESLSYSLERKQFNQSIFDFQGLQFMLADMACELESSRLLVQKAASLYDLNTPSQKIASMAKLKATDAAMKITTDAVQILGGVGYTTEYPVERLMRDAKALQIVEGTNQIQRVVIARSLKSEQERG